MNKTAVIEWFDDDNPDSYLLCIEPYGIKFLKATAIDKNMTELIVYGPTENVNKFLEDFEEDVLEPFETVQSGDYDDEDYEAWLNNEVNRILDLIEYVFDGIMCQLDNITESCDIMSADNMVEKLTDIRVNTASVKHELEELMR